MCRTQLLFVAPFSLVFVLFGLGATAITFDAATRSSRLFKRQYAAVQVVASGVFMAMGVLVPSGELFRLNIEIQAFLDRLGLNFVRNV